MSINKFIFLKFSFQLITTHQYNGLKFVKYVIFLYKNKFINTG